MPQDSYIKLMQNLPHAQLISDIEHGVNATPIEGINVAIVEATPMEELPAITVLRARPQSQNTNFRFHLNCLQKYASDCYWYMTRAGGVIAIITLSSALNIAAAALGAEILNYNPSETTEAGFAGTPFFLLFLTVSLAIFVRQAQNNTVREFSDKFCALLAVIIASSAAANAIGQCILERNSNTNFENTQKQTAAASSIGMFSVLAGGLTLLAVCSSSSHRP